MRNIILCWCYVNVNVNINVQNVMNESDERGEDDLDGREAEGRCLIQVVYKVHI